MNIAVVIYPDVGTDEDVVEVVRTRFSDPDIVRHHYMALRDLYNAGVPVEDVDVQIHAVHDLEVVDDDDLVGD